MAKTEGKDIEQKFNALHLRAEGEHVILEIEVNGKWVQLIKERMDSAFSHIIEPAGIQVRVEALNKVNK